MNHDNNGVTLCEHFVNFVVDGVIDHDNSVDITSSKQISKSDVSMEIKSRVKLNWGSPLPVKSSA